MFRDDAIALEKFREEQKLIKQKEMEEIHMKKVENEKIEKDKLEGVVRVWN